MNRYLIAAVFGFATLTSLAARGENLKGLLEEAFDSQTGSLMAPIDGEMYDTVARATPIQGNLMADIKTIKHFKEKDCRRFRIQLKADFAKDSGMSGPVPLPTMEINYCKGGGFPREGVDEEAGKHFMEQVDQYAKSRATPATKSAPVKQ